MDRPPPSLPFSLFQYGGVHVLYFFSGSFEFVSCCSSFFYLRSCYLFCLYFIFVCFCIFLDFPYVMAIFVPSHFVLGLIAWRPTGRVVGRHLVFFGVASSLFFFCFSCLPAKDLIYPLFVATYLSALFFILFSVVPEIRTPFWECLVPVVD